MGFKKLIQNYRTLGHKEFMKKWKAGTEQATPLQHVGAQLLFTKLTLLGIACGFCVSLYNGKSLWWLAIILGAAFGNTYVGYVGLKQKQKLLKMIESNSQLAIEECKEVSEECLKNLNSAHLQQEQV